MFQTIPLIHAPCNLGARLQSKSCSSSVPSSYPTRLHRMLKPLLPSRLHRAWCVCVLVEYRTGGEGRRGSMDGLSGHSRGRWCQCGGGSMRAAFFLFLQILLFSRPFTNGHYLVAMLCTSRCLSLLAIFFAGFVFLFCFAFFDFFPLLHVYRIALRNSMRNGTFCLWVNLVLGKSRLKLSGVRTCS